MTKVVLAASLTPHELSEECQNYCTEIANALEANFVAWTSGPSD